MEKGREEIVLISIMCVTGYCIYLHNRLLCSAHGAFHRGSQVLSLSVQGFIAFFCMKIQRAAHLSPAPGNPHTGSAGLMSSRMSLCCLGRLLITCDRLEECGLVWGQNRFLHLSPVESCQTEAAGGKWLPPSLWAPGHRERGKTPSVPYPVVCVTADPGKCSVPGPCTWLRGALIRPCSVQSD